MNDTETQLDNRQIPPTKSELALARRVEEASLNAWPALYQVLHHGWILRFSKGFTQRANAISVLYPSAADDTWADARDLAARIDYCEQRYRHAGLPTIFRLTSAIACPQLEQELQNRRYAKGSETIVQRLQLSKGLSLPSPQPRHHSRFVELDAWLDTHHRLTGAGEPARTLHGLILRSIMNECAYLVIYNAQGEPVACGLAVLEGELLGLFDIYTAHQQRRQGLGEAVVAALVGWGRQRQADMAYLQVDTTNVPALNLYRKLGFSGLYRYWYRTDTL